MKLVPFLTFLLLSAGHVHAAVDLTFTGITTLQAEGAIRAEIVVDGHHLYARLAAPLEIEDRKTRYINQITEVALDPGPQEIIKDLILVLDGLKPTDAIFFPDDRRGRNPRPTAKTEFPAALVPRKNVSYNPDLWKLTHVQVDVDLKRIRGTTLVEPKLTAVFEVIVGTDGSTDFFGLSRSSYEASLPMLSKILNDIQVVSLTDKQVREYVTAMRNEKIRNELSAPWGAQLRNRLLDLEAKNHACADDLAILREQTAVEK